MKKLLLVLFLACIFQSAVIAQKAELVVKGGNNGFYLDHKVAAKENFYSVGRLYNIAPKSIASYNKVDMTKGLVIGQVLHIPLSDSNFTQKGNTGTPVLYKAGDNESISTVASKHGISVENLRNWNNLPSENISAGSKVVIGFLMTKEMQAVTLENKTTTTVAAIEQVKEPVAIKEEIKKDPDPVPVKEVVKEEPKKTEPIFTTQQVTPVGDEGFFRTHFAQQVMMSPITKSATVTAGIFKTTSGWQDGKYYMLIDGVQPGTIIRITNPANNKMVFAKVLGEMSGIRQNEGLNIRVSNAAAAALKISDDDKFIVKLNY